MWFDTAETQECAGQTHPKEKERKGETTPVGVNFDEKPNVIPSWPD